MTGLSRLLELARLEWLATLTTTTDPYERGKAEGIVIGLALALDDTNPRKERP